MDCQLLQEPDTQKCSEIYMYPLIHTAYIPHGICAVGMAHGDLLQPPITSREAALLPDQTRHRGSLITDMEAIDNPEITQICQICQIQDKPKGFVFPTVSKEQSVG